MMRALVIEDDEVVQGVLGAYLKHYAAEHEQDIEIEPMQNSGKALDLLSKQSDAFDVIFLDVRMPKLSGDEIYSRLMHLRPDMLHRIIFITSHRDDLTARFPGLDLNILDKPFRYRQLTEAMASIA